MTLKDTIKAASEFSYNEDADSVVGYHPTFGWTHAHNEDEAAISQYKYSFSVNSTGVSLNTIDEQFLNQDWENETTTAIFPDGSKIVFSGPDQEVFG